MSCITAEKLIGQSLILALVAFVGTGCEVEAEGEEGNFNFKYLQSVGTVPQDIAEGARVDLQVVDAETEDPVSLAAVYSEAPDILDIIDQRDSQFTAEAGTAGTTRITAEAAGDDDGEALSDHAQFRVAEATNITFDSACSSDTFLTDGGALVRFRMEDSGGDQLTGYGHYPMAVEPAEGGDVDTDYTRLGFVRLMTGNDPGSYELHSELGDDHIAFELVDAADLEALSVNFEDGDTVATIDPGETRHLAPFSLEIGSDKICGPPGDNVVITTNVPEVCEVRYGREFDAVPTLLDIHAILVEGLDSGVCEITIDIPDAELDATFLVEVR